MSDIPPPPPGFKLVDPTNVPPPPPGFKIVGAQTPAEAPKQEGGIFERLWTGLGGTKNKGTSAVDSMFGQMWTNLKEHGNLLGRKGMLEESAELAQERAKARGGGLPKASEALDMRDPMISAFGVGNIGARQPGFRGAGPAPTAEARMGIAEPTPTPAQTRMQDFTQQGVTPNVANVGQGYATGLAAQVGRVIPGSPVGKAITQNITEAQAATERAASRYGLSANPEDAGHVAENAVRRFTSDRTQATQDYKDVDRLMHGARPAPVTSVLQVWQKLRPKYPSAPGLETDDLVSKIGRALEPKTVNIPAQTSGVLGPTGQPIITRPAQTVQQGGFLSYPELKNLRSEIGAKMDKTEASYKPSDIPKAELKLLYGALSTDLRHAAAQQSPAALRAVMKANVNYGTRQRLIDRIDALTHKDSGEAVFNAINQASGDGKGANAGLLRDVKKVMPPDEWDEIGAAMIRRFGNPTRGAPRPSGAPDFSPASFATNYRKLSGTAKDLLFGVDQPGSRRAGLEQLARVMTDIQNVGRFAGPTTAEKYAVGAAVTYALEQVLVQGRLPWEELAGLGGSYAAAKVMMSPGFTKWLYQLPNTIRGAAQARNRQQVNEAAFAALREAVTGEAQKEESGQARPRQLAPQTRVINRARQEEVASPAGVR